MTDDVSFKWAFTGYSQVLSCEQLDDLFFAR